MTSLYSHVPNLVRILTDIVARKIVTGNQSVELVWKTMREVQVDTAMMPSPNAMAESWKATPVVRDDRSWTSTVLPDGDPHFCSTPT
mmetsp:Transcript_46364/g.120360  ORF Transcript_46364/g.120360 Transcript_46364/m.120360 type:complete len:87 (-) Transcript_46364:237-497(-)